MDTTLGTCRDLQWRDKAAFVALMNQAFTPDPLFQRLFVVGQTEAEASRRSRAFLAFLFDQAYLLGHRLRGLFDGDRLLACYLLEAPGTHWLRRLLGGGCLLSKSLGLPWQVSFAAFGLMNAYMRATRRAAPAVPHYYLRMIGVHASVRGTGLGGLSAARNHCSGRGGCAGTWPGLGYRKPRQPAALLSLRFSAGRGTGPARPATLLPVSPQSAAWDAQYPDPITIQTDESPSACTRPQANDAGVQSPTPRAIKLASMGKASSSSNCTRISMMTRLYSAGISRPALLAARLQAIKRKVG